MAIEAAKNATARSASGEGDPALRFARLGRRPPPCAAYGKPPITVRGNGLWTWSRAISTVRITENGALFNPLDEPADENRGEAAG